MTKVHSGTDLSKWTQLSYSESKQYLIPVIFGKMDIDVFYLCDQIGGLIFMKISVYIAASLDGFIATNTGAVDWLEAIEGDGDNGYGRYYSEVDAVVMGRKTYEVILGFDIPFPYRGKDCFVFTNQLAGSNEEATFINGTIDDLISALSTKDFKKVWIVGGGMLISELMNRHLVDEMIVTVAPVLLGSGVPLFRGISDFHALRLTDTTRYGQLVEMRYVVE